MNILALDIATKTCANPDCENDNPQPLTNFRKARSAEDGRMKICSACRKQGFGKSPSRRKKWLRIDLSKKPDLSEFLTRFSEDMNRSPEDQIITLIENAKFIRDTR